MAPTLQDRVDEGPLGLHLVAAGEQRRVAEHAVQQQALVRVGRLDVGRGAARECHVHRADLWTRTGQLGQEAQGDGVVRLDVHGQDVRFERSVVSVEELMWDRLELYRDLRRPPWQALACAQVEGHTLPAPIV